MNEAHLPYSASPQEVGFLRFNSCRASKLLTLFTSPDHHPKPTLVSQADIQSQCPATSVHVRPPHLHRIPLRRANEAVGAEEGLRSSAGCRETATILDIRRLSYLPALALRLIDFTENDRLFSICHHPRKSLAATLFSTTKLCRMEQQLAPSGRRLARDSDFATTKLTR